MQLEIEFKDYPKKQSWIDTREKYISVGTYFFRKRDMHANVRDEIQALAAFETEEELLNYIQTFLKNYQCI